jgi:nitroreductase
MELMEVIRTRRSIRKMKSDPIDRDTVHEILEAANSAPSASNRQCWEFVVVERPYLERMQKTLADSFRQRVEEVTETAYRNGLVDLPIPTDPSGDKVAGLGEFYRTLGGAPLAVIITVPRTKDPWAMYNNLKDGSAAMENLLLAAWDKGLGTCWMTGPLKHKQAEILDLLGLPGDREIIGIAPIGRPDHRPPAPPKVDVKSKTRWLA